MTLKPIDNEFSSRLLAELNNEENFFDLSLNAVILDSLPPQVLYKKIELEHGPQQETSISKFNDYFLHCFSDLTEAKKVYPTANIYAGRPCDYFQFQQQRPQTALIDFSPLGVVYFSKEPLSEQQGTSPYLHLLPLWLRYASSDDLWSPHGKWMRFHAELEQVLKEKNLLASDHWPGYYPLKKEAKKLEALNFKGSELEHFYLFVLPWSFSLSALKQLIKVIQQEL